MTIMFHSDRYAGRAIGKPTSGRMSSRDPELVGKAVRQLFQRVDWAQTPGGSDQIKVQTVLQSRMAYAVGMFPAEALIALTKVPPSPGCHWCSALVQVLPRPELPRTPANLALLGQGCATCQTRWTRQAAAAEAAEQERQYAAAMAAAGFTAAELASYKRMGGRVPTGVIWTASQGQPATVTAALEAASRRSRRRPS